jgi:hypothetical protein
MRLKLFLALLIVAAACDRAEDEPADAATDTASVLEVNDTVRFDTVMPDNTPPIARAVAPLNFDPATVEAGDRVGSLTVSRVRRPPDDHIVTFSGEVEVNGRYLTHPEYPEVKLPCFWVDPDSWAKLPRAENDQRLIWFCFENGAEAIRQLGALGTRMLATIVIDDYKTALSESDVFDSAHLVRVVRKQAVK